MEKNKMSTVSKADSWEKMGEFWDTHDFTDFDDPEAPDVKFDISCSVPIEEELFSEMEKQARLRGVGVETLVNMWLQQKLTEHIRMLAAQKKV